MRGRYRGKDFKARVESEGRYLSDVFLADQSFQSVEMFT